MRLVVALSAILLCSAVSVQAQEFQKTHGEEETTIPPWGGDVEVGVVLSRGNTEATAVRTNAELKHELEDFRNKYYIQTLLQRNTQTNSATGEKEDNTTGQRVGVTAQSNYKLHRSDSSFFGRAAYLNDRFGAFREQSSLAVGYANRLYENGQNYLDFETGPGLAYDRPSEGESNSGMIWYAAGNFEYHFSETSKFKQTLEYAISLDGHNTSYTSRSAITAQINNELALRLSVNIKYDSDVGVDKKSTDSETSASVVYSF
jgi:putative salt-induced outer membrane protein